MIESRKVSALCKIYRIKAPNREECGGKLGDRHGHRPRFRVVQNIVHKPTCEKRNCGEPKSPGSRAKQFGCPQYKGHRGSILNKVAMNADALLKNRIIPVPSQHIQFAAQKTNPAGHWNKRYYIHRDESRCYRNGGHRDLPVCVRPLLPGSW